MIALIDGDIIAYRCAASAEEEDVEIAFLRISQTMHGILEATQATSYEVFLGGAENFRYTFYPEYKATRKTQPRPKWLVPAQTFLQEHWNAKVTDGYETDDALGMNQTEGTVICSIDKDLLQIPGLHYNFVKDVFTRVSEWDGLKHFYMQLLHGDRTDDIWGLKGVGPKKAEKYLEGCETEDEMLAVARALYNDDILLDKYAKCLWIWHTYGDIWDKLLIGEKKLLPEEDPLSGSTTQLPEEKNQSMEHIKVTANGTLPVGQSPGIIEKMEPKLPST